MARMLNPNPGEVVDRQTILKLKCEFGVKKRINVAKFVEENEQLQKYLEKQWFLLAPKTIQHDFDTLMAELSRVNAQLWNLEDDMRTYKKAHQQFGSTTAISASRVMQAAFQIADLNDKRAQLVQDINQLFGCVSLEKLYA